MNIFKLKSFLLLVFMILQSRFSYASEIILSQFCLLGFSSLAYWRFVGLVSRALCILLSSLMASGTTYTKLLKLGTIDILGHIISHCGGCPVYCRIFCNIPGLYPLDASITPIPVATNKTFSKHCWMSSGSQNHPPYSITTYLFL